MDSALFDEVVSFVRGLSDFDGCHFITQISNEEKLKLYALFKQATVGTCTGPRPSFFDVQGRYKFDSWKELGDMTRSLAMSKYVEHVVEYAMKVQSQLLDTHPSLEASERRLAEGLLRRIDRLKEDCAIFWPQRFAHLRSPSAIEAENEEVTSFGEQEDAAFSTPLILAEDMNMPIPGSFTNLIPSRGGSSEISTEEDVSEENRRDEDPLHVKEPRLVDSSTDSFPRRSPPVENELYEMVLSSMRRLDALETTSHHLQRRLQQLHDEHIARVQFVIRVAALFGVTSGTILLYILMKRVRQAFVGN